MHNHDRGLGFDLATLRSRRHALALFGGAGLAVLAGCSSTGIPSGSPATTGASGQGANVDEIPQETAGPYPGDGSNGPNVLTESGIVRGDIRSSFEADASGGLTFTSIFPAAYSGRWPHIRFEVYRSLSEATRAGNRITTSQLALPEEVCRTVYATDGHSTSVRNLAQTSLKSDMVFRDGYDRQLATVTGDISSGLTAALAIGV